MCVWNVVRCHNSRIRRSSTSAVHLSEHPPVISRRNTRREVGSPSVVAMSVIIPSYPAIMPPVMITLRPGAGIGILSNIRSTSDVNCPAIRWKISISLSGITA